MSAPDLSDADWLACRARTLFELDAQGRLLRPFNDARPAPRAFVQRTASVTDIRLRLGEPDSTADEALRAFEASPAGPVYEQPNAAPVPPGHHLVRSWEDDGRQVNAAWRAGGFPKSLLDLGFIDADDVWQPWVLLMNDGEIAALCQSARLTAEGAEVGVITAPSFRGRGFAGVVTAAWTGCPALADLSLFYSTSATNFASQAVAAKLGLVLRARDFSLL